MSKELYLVDDNLSRLWAKAFCAVMHPCMNDKIPLVVTLDIPQSNKIEEILEIRLELDGMLIETNNFNCDTVSNTIFPASLWNPKLDRTKLFERYLRIFPKIRRGCSKNRLGTYFQRLIKYGPKNINQLDQIIKFYNSGNHRRSAMQMAVFDPNEDLKNQRQRGFPCLQHVIITPMADGLAVTGFYATQHIFDRAYGNYMGLIALGRFVAHELGLNLTRMNCVASVAVPGYVNRSEVLRLLDLCLKVSEKE